MTLPLGKTRLKAHPAMLLWGALAILLGKMPTCLAAFAALTVHEAGHILAASCCRLPVSSIELTPFGAVMRIEGLDAAPPGQALLIALGGPSSSLFGCLLSPLLLRFSWMPYLFAQDFARFSLLLCLVNLLPALPLDGGRALQAVLSRRFSSHTVTRALVYAGYLVGSALGCISLVMALRGVLAPLPAFAGLYLIYAAAISRRQSGLYFVSSLIARRNRLDSTIPLPVEAFAARPDLPLRALLPRLHPGKAHLVFITPPSGVGMMGMVDDQQLADALMSFPDACLKDCPQTPFPT